MCSSFVSEFCHVATVTAVTELGQVIMFGEKIDEPSYMKFTRLDDNQKISSLLGEASEIQRDVHRL